MLEAPRDCIWSLTSTACFAAKDTSEQIVRRVSKIRGITMLRAVLPANSHTSKNDYQAGHGKKAKVDDEDEDMSDSDEDQEDFSPPVLHMHMFSLSHGTNRIRCMPQKPGIVAVWEDSGSVKVRYCFSRTRSNKIKHRFLIDQAYQLPHPLQLDQLYMICEKQWLNAQASSSKPIRDQE